MKQNKKGFTLIELLAVIVILAVIALIATPLIMNVINDAKKGAARDAGYSVIKAGELKAATSGIENTNPPYHYDETSNLSMKGTKPTKFTLDINEEMDTQLRAWINGFCVIKNYGNETVMIDEKQKNETDCVNSETATAESCFITKDIISEDDITIHEDQCVEFFKEQPDGNQTQEEIEKICKNEIIPGLDMTLKDFIMEMYHSDEMDLINYLLDNGVITIKEDRRVTITGYNLDYKKCTTDVVIPNKINGKTVVAVSAEAFFTGINSVKTKNELPRSPITSVKFPSSIISIGEGAFYENQITRELDLSNLDHIKEIGIEAFVNENRGSYNTLYLPNKYINYLKEDYSKPAILDDFFNVSYLKIKKGTIDPEDIINEYNHTIEDTNHCSQFVSVLEETDQYIKYGKIDC